VPVPELTLSLECLEQELVVWEVSLECPVCLACLEWLLEVVLPAWEEWATWTLLKSKE